MAFSFGNANQTAFGAVRPATAMSGNAQTGPDLLDIQTEAIGFLAIAGEAKLQLLPSPWPMENLPPATSSLMSIAPQKGLVAAAGPDCVILATSESIRKAYETPRINEHQTRPFQAQLTLTMDMRISQVAFTADETYLVLSAEVGGGLAVYEVQNLMNGSQTSAFEMSTNSNPLRALVPNPTAEKGELLAIVTTDGKLMIANLKEKNFVSGANGQVLKDGVTCISWSAKGKQLVAGLADGSAFQMTPEGVAKAQLPRPPDVDPGHHVSSITWLENDVFMMVHNPSNFDSTQAPASVFHLVTRLPKSTDHVYQKLADPAPNFGLNRSPPHHFLLRLRDFPPNLKDLIIVASTASTDIGLFTRSTVPLVSDKPHDQITGVFTMTEMSDDSRRAQLPVNETMEDTSPIGAVLDLSAREKVLKPIPSDEMDESRTPLPALLVLNNEGILASWWVVYSESVRQGSSYPGLVAATEAQSGSAIQPFSGDSNLNSVPAFRQSAFGSSPSAGSAFGSLSKPAAAFGSNSPLSANSGNAFGAQSSLNSKPSVWANSASDATAATKAALGTASFGSSSAPAFGAPAFGAPAFGSPAAPSAGGVAFGSSALPGSRPSPWTAAGSGAPGPAFGQSSSFGAGAASNSGAESSGSIFGSRPSAASPATGGFASFASKGGFAAVGASEGSTGNIFATKSDSIGFPAAPKVADSASSFGGIGIPAVAQPGGLFSSQGFTLGSSFKPDGSKDDGSKLGNAGSSSFFDNGFGKALGEAQKSPVTASPEASMDDDIEPTQEPSSFPKDDATLGMPKSAGTTVHSLPATKSSGFSFGAPAEAKVGDDNHKGFPPFPPSSVSPDSKVKNRQSGIPEAPLPPDILTKNNFTTGESTVSFPEPEAPLPPDFMAAPKSHMTEMSKSDIPPSTKDSPNPANIIPPLEVPASPEDSYSPNYSGEEDQSYDEDEEGSGEDIAKDISPAGGSTPDLTPESSFGKSKYASRESASFGKGLVAGHESSAKSFFGEIGNRSTPVLLPPKPESPRSPSPIRSSVPARLLGRSDISRSVSAPIAASQLLGDRARPMSSSIFGQTLGHSEEEERRRGEVLKKKEVDESQALVDAEDERMQDFLGRDIEGTTRLDEFVAHQDYVGSTDKDSIPFQVEAVYRDINSMIDTLGINSHTLKCFVKGHTEHYKDPGRERADLEGEDEWCLGEIENLSSMIVKDLSNELEQGRLKNTAEKLELCSGLIKELTKLHARTEDISMVVSSSLDQDHATLNRSQPLTAEQAAQQHDLRRDFANFQKLLGNAEEELILLRAKLASLGGFHGKATPVPTVEAVMRTVMKMTAMAEKRSGDVDVIENQMRRLRFSSVSTNDRGSRESSPFTSPSKSTARRAPIFSTNGRRPRTPEGSRNPPRALHTSLSSSIRSQSHLTPPRKKLGGFTEEDKAIIKNSISKRNEVTDKLKAVLGKSKTRIRPMEDD